MTAKINKLHRLDMKLNISPMLQGENYRFCTITISFEKFPCKNQKKTTNIATLN